MREKTLSPLFLSTALALQKDECKAGVNRPLGYSTYTYTSAEKLFFKKY